MPASICDPVSSALRLSLTADDSTNSALLDNRLISSAKSVLLTKIDFEESGDYQSNILDGLKSKYVVIRPKKPMQDNKQLKKDAINNSAPKDQQQQSQEYSLPVPKKILFPVESVRLGWSGKEWQVGTGMQNIGNTCYLNSTLQALFHVPALANWLMSEAQHSDKCRQSEGCVICGMRSTFLAAQRSSGPIKPWQVYSKLRLICRHLMPGRQEDAHEFLRYLVEAMEKSYLSRCGNMEKHLDQYSKETTPLNQILGGYLRSAVRCLSCGHVSTTFQHFQDLLLDIRKATTLEEALDLFFSRERLEDLGYKCEACNKKVSATKQFYIERAPMVLCIALKRFSLAGGKLSKHIQFRKKIMLNKYIFHKNKQSLLSYRLVGMVTHLGPSQNCGHYTAIGQAPGGGYYQFDDSCVRSIPLSTVLGTNAYIIFFEKESCTPEETVVSSESPFKINKEIQKSTESTSSNTVYGPVLPDNVTMNREKGPMKLNFYKNDEQRQSISFTVANNQNANLKFSLKEMNGTSLSNGNGINMAQSTENEMPKSTAPLAIKQNGEIVPFRPTTLNVTPIDQSNGRTLDEGQSNKTANFITKGSKLVNYAHSNYTQSKSLSKLETKFDNSESNGHMNGVNHKNGDIGKNDLIQTKASPVKSKTQLKTEKSEAELRTRIENHRLSETNSSGASAYSYGASTSSSVNGNGNRSSCVSNGARLVPYDSESSGDEKSRDDESFRPMRKSPLSCNGKPEVFITTKATQHCWKVSTEQNRPLLSPSLNGVVNNKLKENDLSSNGGKEVNGNHRICPEETSARVQVRVNGHSKMTQAKTGHVNETVSKLQMMSHRGYGQPIQSWVGTHTSMGRQVFEEHRNERKRALEGVDEMDQGRVKKPRKFGKFNNTNESNNNSNPFQAKQNHQRDTHGGWRGFNKRPSHDRRSFHQNFYRNGNGNGPYKNYKRFDWHGRGHRYYRQH